MAGSPAAGACGEQPCGGGEEKRHTGSIFQSDSIQRRQIPEARKLHAPRQGCGEGTGHNARQLQCGGIEGRPLCQEFGVGKGQMGKDTGAVERRIQSFRRLHQAGRIHRPGQGEGVRLWRSPAFGGTQRAGHHEIRRPEGGAYVQLWRQKVVLCRGNGDLERPRRTHPYAQSLFRLRILFPHAGRRCAGYGRLHGVRQFLLSLE